MKVMIALDESEYSRQVVTKMSQRHWPEGCQFKLLTVVEPLNVTDETRHAQVLSEIQEHRLEAARQFLSRSREELESVAGSNVHFEIREGRPIDQIIDSAVEWEPERLILGARGGSAGETRAALGNVSRTAALYSPCTVEIVRV